MQEVADIDLSITGKRSADEVANDTQDEASKKQKITTMTTHGDENEVLRQIISKERLARTTASVLRGNKVSQILLCGF